MRTLYTYWRPQASRDAPWEPIQKHENMDAAVAKAASEWERHPDRSVIVMLFPSSTSPFWQGRVVWETPGTDLMFSD